MGKTRTWRDMHHRECQQKRRTAVKADDVGEAVITAETIFEFVEFGSEMAEMIMDSIGDGYE